MSLVILFALHTSTTCFKKILDRPLDKQLIIKKKIQIPYTSDNIKLEMSNEEAEVSDWPVARTVNDLHRFLGFADFMRGLFVDSDLSLLHSHAY